MLSAPLIERFPVEDVVATLSWVIDKLDEVPKVRLPVKLSNVFVVVLLLLVMVAAPLIVSVTPEEAWVIRVALPVLFTSIVRVWPGLVVIV